MISGWGVTGGDSAEVDDDGTWSVLLTSGAGAAGRFGDKLTDDELSELRRLVAAAVAAGPPARDPDTPWAAGGSVETLYAAETVGQIAAGEQWPAGWQPLAEWTAGLVEHAASHPVAALVLDPAGDGALRHAGTASLQTDGSGFAVQAYESAADGAIGKSWDSTIPGPDGGTVQVGFGCALGLESAGLTAPAGGSVEVSVSFTLIDPPPQSVSVWASIPAADIPEA